MAEERVLPTAPPAFEVSEWEKNGFLRELASICSNLEGVEDQHIFTPEVRQIVDTILNLKTIEDFAVYSNEELNHFANVLRREVPKIEREVMQFVTQISRARTVAFEVDFI